MRLGIFGGTFDPPHIGHLILSSEAYVQLELDKVLWVLTHYPPHKVGQSLTPLNDRLDLLRAALHKNSTFEISRVDIDRQPPHYAVDTMHLLREQFPTDILVYLMGGDSLVDLALWHKPQEFILACDEIGVMRRLGWSEDCELLNRQFPSLEKRIRFVDAPLLEISSSWIRAKIYADGPYRYYLPQNVYSIIHERRLYSEPNGSR
jgi:nicotinate-nucleotide adenylyltransferase